MFRMKPPCFNELCDTIKCDVVKSKFKSQNYIDAFLDDNNPLYNSNHLSTGGYISGVIRIYVP